MPDTLVTAIVFSLSQLVLSLLLLCRIPAWRLREWLYSLLLLAILGYLLTPLTSGSSLGWLAVTVQTAAPGMFWLFSASVFDDHFRLRAWQVALVAVTVVMPLLGRLLSFAGVHLDGLFFTAPQALEFGLLGLALWAMSRYWRTDLVEERRRLRLCFVGLSGTYTTLLLFSREIFFPGEAWLETWEYVPLAGLLLTTNVMLLRYRTDILFDIGPARVDPMALAGPAAAPIDAALVNQLQDYMHDQFAWREMSLTIGQLAERLDVPQYRLRQAINGGLGYRNFSDFLNRYRVAEAAERLADPAHTQLPVLTIAMDAGFRSLSSFNKAFKEMQGVTPTAWRKSQLEK
jgi:AraC-like DNA-binding protein